MLQRVYEDATMLERRPISERVSPRVNEAIENYLQNDFFRKRLRQYMNGIILNRLSSKLIVVLPLLQAMQKESELVYRHHELVNLFM